MAILSTVFQAEVMAILRCTELLLSKYVTRKIIQIRFDGKAAIAALAKSTTESSLVWENIPFPRKLSGSIKGTVVWTGGHHRIPGNEEADKLVKEGANGVPSDQTVGIPFVVVKEFIRSNWRKEHLKSWKTCKGCRQSKTLMSGFLSNRTKELQTMSRQKPKGTVGLLTGHTILGVPYVKHRTHRKARLPAVATKKKCTYCMLLSDIGMQMLQNLESCVIDT